MTNLNSKEFQNQKSVLDNLEIKEEININEKSNAHFYTLLSMFPNVDKNYIDKICNKLPFDKIESEDETLSMLIDHLLNYEDKDFICHDNQYQKNEGTSNDHLLADILQNEYLIKMREEKENEKKLNDQLCLEFIQKNQNFVEDKLKILENILPDADPNIFKQFIEQNNDNISLEEFVESILVDKNYKKRDHYFKELRMKEKIESYINNFNVEKFIEQFPDPFEYFENPERKKSYEEKAIQFLRSRYKYCDVQFLKNLYSINYYNLSLTDKELQKSFVNNQLLEYKVDTNDLAFLEEIAFIQNKSSIKQYLQTVKNQEEQQLELLRAQQLLLECECCYGEVNPTKCIECDNNHIFCKKCVIKGTEIAISNGKTFVHCFMGCNSEFPLNILRNVLPSNIFDIFLKKRQEAEVIAAKLDGLITCPFCPYSMELTSEIIIFTCKNPECMKITCRLCKKINHLPTKCEDVVDEHKGRLFIEEEMSKALIRICYKCNKPFVKDNGCNKMQCHCGAIMCYVCNMPITGYGHFERINGCRTHQNSDLLDKERVLARKVEASTKLLVNNPDLKIPEI